VHDFGATADGFGEAGGFFGSATSHFGVGLLETEVFTVPLTKCNQSAFTDANIIKNFVNGGGSR
jgi:hypothetical protein